MPQLDVSTYASQIFWLVITFVPLYIFVVKVALPRIGEVLEARQDKIDDDLKVAAERRDEAEAVLAEYQRLQAEAHAKAQEAIREAQDAIKAEAVTQSQALAEKLSNQTTEAEARIAAAQAEALANLESTVSEAVAAATNKLIGVTPSDDKIRAAVAAGRGES